MANWKLRRRPHVKPGQLAVYYAKLKHQDPDVVIHNEAPARRADAHYIHQVFNNERFDYQGKPLPSVVAELMARGYDITSLRFSIEIAASPVSNPVPHPEHAKREE